MIGAKKQKNTLAREVNQRLLDVDLYELKDKVNALFFGIILAREQRTLLATSLADIDTRLAALQAGYENGTVLESELAKLRVKKLELLSEDQNLEGTIAAQAHVLEALSGIKIDNDTRLELPETGILPYEDAVTRPEIDLYDARESTLEVEKDLLTARQLPRISAFAQGGYSDPNRFNFFDTNGKEFAIGGLRLSWNFFDWGIAKTRRLELDMRRNELENQKQTFVHNVGSRQEEFRENSDKILKQIANATEIAVLQKEILTQYNAQLENGVINVTEYLLQLNAELRARQQLELHKIELKRLQIDYLTLFGKL
jgi:outer membrane protein TolC